MLHHPKQPREFLEKQGYALVDAQGDRASLAYTLLFLAHCAPPSILLNCIWVVATLLKLETATEWTDAVWIGVMKRLEPFLVIVEHTAESATGCGGGVQKGHRQAV